MKKWLNLLYPLFLLLIIGIFFRAFFLEGKVPLPADTLVGLYHPYRDLYADTNPNGIAYKNFLITDPIRQQYPWRYTAIKDEKEANLPLWNPYSGGGEPLFANIQSAVLYPLNVLLFILPFNTGWSMLIVLQLVIGGLGMYYFLRNKGLSFEASFLGSVSYIFSGFFVAWLTWNTLVHIAAWLPIALLAVDKILNAQKGKEILLWCMAVILILVTAFFAGHLQTYFYISLCIGAYVLLQIFLGGKRRQSMILFFSVAANILVIISLQLIATLVLIQQSARDTDQQFLLKEGWFVPWQHLVQFIAPDFFGNPATLNYWGTWNYGEMVGYIGLISLFFAMYALFRIKDKTIMFFAAVVTLALLFALPTFIAKIPFVLDMPFLSTSQPTRLMVLIDFSLCVLAAYGFDAFLKNKKGDRKSVVLLLAFIAVFAGLWMYVLTLHGKSDPQMLTNVLVSKRNLYIPTALLGFLTLFIIAMMVLKKKYQHILVITLLIVLSFDLLRFSSKFNPFVSPEYIFPMTKTIAFLQKHTKDYPWRFIGVDEGNQKRVFPPNIADYYSLYTLDTYNPLLLKNFQNYAAASEFGITDGDTFSFNRIIALNNYDSRLVSLAGVKYLASLSPISNRDYILRISEGQTKVYENMKVYPRAFMTYNYIVEPENSKATRLLLDKKIDLRTTVIVSEEPSFQPTKSKVNSSVALRAYNANSIVLSVSTDRTGLLLLTDTFYPTWKVAVDGQPEKIIRADVAFRGVVVPKGNHEIIFYTNIL
jgi:hypothetical protein